MRKLILASALLFHTATAWAALPVAVYECRSSATAGNVNGGGWNSARGGSDYTLQDAAQVHSTDGVSTASTNFTSVTGGFTDAMKGNFLHLISATGADEVVGWYEIVSVTDANTVVLDRTSGTYTLADFYIGGAMSLASTLDDEFFEIFIAGSTVWVKAGTYTMGEAVSVVNDATAALPTNINGYNATRGDNPTGASRPTLDFAANQSAFAGNYYNFRNFIITTTSAAGFETGTGQILENIKITNSGTAGKEAMTISSGDTGTRVINCELISTNGTACENDGSHTRFVGCYFHDSVGGLVSTASGVLLTYCIFDTCTTALSIGATGDRIMAINNTFYGAETPAGTGVTITDTSAIESIFLNNIIYGFTTGVTTVSALETNFWDYNDFYNNTTARTNVTAGAHDLAVDPTFTSAAAGDFSIGTNLKAAGFPGAFQGGLSTGYLDVGAVQRQEAGSSTNVLGEITG